MKRAALVGALGTLAWSWLGAGAALAAGPFQVQELIASSNSNPTCLAAGNQINASGDVVGIAAFTPPVTARSSVFGYLWHAGAFTQLKQVDGSFSRVSGTPSQCSGVVPNDNAVSINASGQIAGTATSPDGLHYYASIWAPGGTGSASDAEGSLPVKGCSQNLYTTGYAINDAGDMTGAASASCPSPPNIDAVALWKNGTVQDVFDSPDLNTISVAGVAINSSDQILIDQHTNSTQLPYQLWSKGTVTQLPLQAIFDRPGVLNDAGVVVGQSAASRPAYSAAGRAAVTLTPAGGGASGEALGVDSFGDVVGWSENSSFDQVATLWQKAAPPAMPTSNNPIDLNSLIPAGLNDFLTQADAINSAGQILAFGSDGGGNFAYFVLSPGGQQISGTITTPAGDGLAGVTVRLTGTDATSQPVSLTQITGANGGYSFSGLDPGTYTVTPLPANPSGGADEFTPTQCDGGSLGATSCNNMVLASNGQETANFTGAFALTGKVTGTDGKGVAGATVLFQDTEQGVLKTSTATTDGTGAFKASLPPGSVVAAVQPLNGSQYFPDPSPDCVPSNVSCQVNLNEDRNIAFSACIVPNPDGSPLPANTPDPIPGAILKPPLEAVGCWTPENGTSTTATKFTSTQPIRLDGIDVDPTSGGHTTFTLDTAGPTVTSSGPAQLLVGGVPVTLSHEISLTYHGGANSAGAGLSIGDLGAGTGPLSANLFGLPISLGTGGPAGYGLPFTEATGQTVFNLGVQFALPSNTRATWSPLDGVFKDYFGNNVPSIGLGGQIIASDRLGVVGQGCASINDWQPFGGKLGELSGLNICYTPSTRQWQGTGMWQTPSAIAKVVGDVYAQITLQNAISAKTNQLQGYKLQAIQIQFDHLNTKSFSIRGIVPGGSAWTSSDVRASGIPIGAGFFLQSLGAGFQNNLVTNTLASFNGTIGVSLGPEFEVASAKLNLLRFDGKAEIRPPQTPGDAWTFQLAGAGTLGRLTPFELQLGNASVTYRADANAPEGDFTFHLGGSLPVVGGVSVDVAGESDVAHGVAFEGVQKATLFGHTGTNDVLLNASNLFVLPPGAPPAVLADCLTTSGGFETGFTIDFVSLAPKLGCNMGNLFHPKLLPAATGASVAGVAATAHRVRLGGGLAGTMLVVSGTTAAPRFTLTGPGLRVSTPGSSAPAFSRRAAIFTDAVGRRTYVALSAPRAGVYAIRPLAGSSPITSVMQSVPLPRPKLLRAAVVRGGCSDQLRYKLTPASGDRVLVWAREGNNAHAVGFLGRSGALTVPLVAGVKGRGTLVAYYLRGASPFAASTIATFQNAASNGSERVSGVRVSSRTLTWAATCGATSYAVTVKQGKSTSRTTTGKAKLALRSSRRPVTVTIVAAGAGGEVLAKASHTFKR